MCFLFVDRIVTSTPGKIIRGVKHVTWDDTYLSADQEGRACFAPSLIGETLGQLAAWNVMAYHDFTLRPVAGIVSSTRLLRMVYPGETLLLESVIDELDDTAVRYHSIARVGDSPVFVVEGAIGPLLPMSDFIDAEAVLRQFNAINRPGAWDTLVSEMTSILPSDTQEFSVGSPMHRVSGTSLSFDRARVVEPGHHWIAEKLVSKTAVYFADHFPNNPVLPMTVLLECMLHLAREFVDALSVQSPRANPYKVSELRRIKMNEFVRPGDIVKTHLKLKSQNDNELILSGQSFVEEKRVCIVEIVLISA